jgi:hypothetical protein
LCGQARCWGYFELRPNDEEGRIEIGILVVLDGDVQCVREPCLKLFLCIEQHGIASEIPGGVGYGEKSRDMELVALLRCRECARPNGIFGASTLYNPLGVADVVSIPTSVPCTGDRGA